ncbi:MAG TPA: bifunctional UDP-N-acetylglucosamine diphosphorylase/glucosamine-1-phosphate N-acetyltransferase GlmU [Blastocatellia bacterium]|nr:bifunctional UDP-N-acetylglucosamine diphosphorylase/glucosamine-1-phosphate N-acetyltransferase GlmU [Blastocatellia bacterium]
MAAGLGTRMKSRRAKVLHEVGGSPLVSHVVRSASNLDPGGIFIVVGHQAEQVEKTVRDEIERRRSYGHGFEAQLEFVLQSEQRGTGHAVMSARERLQGRPGPLVILAGDGPMIKPETLRKLVDSHTSEQNAATLLTVEMDDPAGYGRIIRDEAGNYARGVEQKDASPEELAIREVNVSIYCFDIPSLLEALDHLDTDNVQGEYYLTDVPGIMRRSGAKVGLVLHGDSGEVLGINTRIDLAELERRLRGQKLRELMLSGVTIVDPASTYIHPEVEIGQDTIIHPSVIIEGFSRIGSDCVIQSWTRLRDVEIGDGVTVRNSTVIEESAVHDRASIGPFARLRMHADIGERAAIGNFVEVKKSKIGRGTKASHLTYLGDATLGDKVNIGAGTVTCNYDGERKHETVIEDGAKIGSDTMLVAPVRVGRNSVTGAGSVITRDIPPDSLAVGVPAKVKKKLH